MLNISECCPYFSNGACRIFILCLESLNYGNIYASADFLISVGFPRGGCRGMYSKKVNSTFCPMAYGSRSQSQ